MQTDLTTLPLTISILLFAIDLAIRIALVIYIPRNRKPTAAMAWLLMIFIVPIIGTLFFLLIGSTKLSRNRRYKQVAIDQALKKYSASVRKSKPSSDAPVAYTNQAKLAEAMGVMAPIGGNDVEIISGYNRIITDMTNKVDTAKQYVYVEFFAMTLDDATEPFFAALERACKRGVNVYVLFDTLGSRKYAGYKPMMARLSDMGARWSKMLPISFVPSRYNRPDLRNHRKIVVVDNTYAYIGSLNMIDKTYHRKDTISYVELMARTQGPFVGEHAAVFASDWYNETGETLTHFINNSLVSPRGKTVAQILPSGPGYSYQNNLKYFVSLIHTATTSVVITNPYLVPDESLLAAIISVAQRGVKVSILNSQVMDQWMVGHAQRSYYKELMQAGVTISLYPSPQLLHSKYMVVDQQVAIVGSSNLDVRSFELDLECVGIFYDPAVAKKLYAQHMSDQHKSSAIDLATWRGRGVWTEFLDSIARLTSALQ